MQKKRLTFVLVLLLITVSVGVIKYFYGPSQVIAPVIEKENNWKTYTNKEYKFSFQYPLTQNPRLEKTSEGKDYLSIYQNIGFIILPKTGRVRDCKGICPTINKEEQVKIGSVTFNKITATPYGEETWPKGAFPQVFYWEVDLDKDTVGQFTVGIDDRNNTKEKDELLKIANQILSTFKF